MEAVHPRFEGFGGGNGKLCFCPSGDFAEPVLNEVLQEFAAFQGTARLEAFLASVRPT